MTIEIVHPTQKLDFILPPDRTDQLADDYKYNLRIIGSLGAEAVNCFGISYVQENLEIREAFYQEGLNDNQIDSLVYVPSLHETLAI